MSLTVLDIASGRPVRNVSVTVSAYDGKVELVTDAYGKVQFNPEGAGAIRVAPSEWRECRLRHREPLVDGVLWVYKMLRIDGLVKTSQPSNDFAATQVRLSAFIDDEAPPVDAEVGAETRAVPDWEDRWHFMRQISLPKRAVGEDGHFSVELPRIRGLVIGAACRGWQPDTAHLDAFMNDTAAVVHLTLTKGLAVRGYLSDESGNPLANRSVWGFTIVQVPTSDVSQYSRLQHRAPDGSFGGAGDLVTGRGFAKYQHHAVTDEHGRFEFSIGVKGGETYLFGYVEGCAPLEAELGSLANDVDDVRLVARKPDREVSLQVLVDGAPLSQEPILLTDLDYGRGEAQPAIQLETDSSGSISADWLQAGRRYSMYHLRKGGEGPLPGGCFEWKGQSSLDLVHSVRPYDDVVANR